MFVSIIFFRLSRNKINQFIASFVFLIVVAFTSDRSSFFNLRKSKQIIAYEQFENEFDVENQFENFSSFVFDITLSFDITWNLIKKTLKKILLSNNLNLSNNAISSVNVQILRAFNAAINFISENKIYETTICKCVKIKNMLRYKVDHIQLKLNELIIMIIKFKRIYKKEKNVVCLTY